MEHSVQPDYQHHDPTMINTGHEERTNYRPFSRQTLICCDIGPLCITEGLFYVFSGRSRPLVRVWTIINAGCLFEYFTKVFSQSAFLHLFIKRFKWTWPKLRELSGTLRNNRFLGAVTGESVLSFLFLKAPILSHSSDRWYLSGFECWHFWGESWRCHTEGKDVKRVIHTYYMGVRYYWLCCLVKEGLFMTFKIEVSYIFLFCIYIVTDHRHKFLG